MPISVAGSGAITGTSSINGLAMPSDAIAPGMVLVASATLSGSSVSINNCFSSTYDNYRILISSYSSSQAADVYVRLRSAGTDNTTALYDYQYLQGYSASVAAGLTSNSSLFRVGTSSATGIKNNGVIMDVIAPYLVQNTVVTSMYVGTASTNVQLWYGIHKVDTSLDGITVYPSAGTWATGNIRIYGYRNA